MPIYEYLCKDCEQIFEEWQKDFSERVAACPICGGDAHRIISHTSFVLKGTGWYVTDYQGGRANGGNGACSTDKDGDSKPEGAGKATEAAAKAPSAPDAPKKAEAPASASSASPS
jgi:putative FmdB family regulatory protein